MNLKDYQQAALRTLPDLGSLENNLLHMDCGIFTEIGEILDILKKNFAYKKEVDKVHLGEEIGDCMWYVGNKLNILQQEFDELTQGKEKVDLTIPDLIEQIIEYYREFADKPYVMTLLCYNIATYFDLNFEDILEKNINKLKGRYPDKFSEEKALNRDLDNERKILES